MAARIIVNLRDASAIFRYAGDRVVGEDGYILLWSEAEGRYFSEHRLVVEAALGRRLRTEEEVHHVNGNRQDNSKGNLIVCSPEYHKYLDALMRLRRGFLQRRIRRQTEIRQHRTVDSFLGLPRSGRKLSSSQRSILKKIEAYTYPKDTNKSTRKSGGQ